MPVRNILREISPAELGEPEMGEKDHDMDLHCKKYRVISPKMQEEEKIAEKKLYKQFVDELIQDPQKRVWTSIPKNNLCIPFKWFYFDSDAAMFIKAVAKANDVAVDCFGKSTTANTLCVFMDSVWNHRHLRLKKEEDPPRMTLQERRIRHWTAVIAHCCIAKDFTLRLVRHVTLMLVGASFDFVQQNGQRSKSSDLGGKIEKMRKWFEENDLEDLKAFEFLQPKRQAPHAPKGNGLSKSNGKEKRNDDGNNRKRKADTIAPHEGVRPKRQCQMRSHTPTQGANDGSKGPKRIAEGKRGKKGRNGRA